MCARQLSAKRSQHLNNDISNSRCPTNKKLCNRKSFDRSIFTWQMSGRKSSFDHKLLRVRCSRAQNLFSKIGCATLHSTHNNKFHRSHESIATASTVWMDKKRKTNSSRRPSITRSAEMRTAIIFIPNCRCNIDSHVCTSHIVSKNSVRRSTISAANNNDDDNEDENGRC